MDLHTLCKKNKKDRISMVTSFPSSQKNDQFLKNIIRVDEKWGLYDNVQRSRFSSMNLRYIPERWSFMEEKVCSVYGWTIVVLLILSFKTGQSMQTFDSCIVCMKSLSENTLHSSIRGNLYFTETKIIHNSIHTHKHTHTNTHTHIYIYIERERENTYII